MTGVREGDRRGSSHDVRRRYLPELTSVPEARRLVSRSLEAWGLGAVAHDAALCTAELVTNAVLHAGTDLEVSVGRLGAGVHVGVRDSSPRRLPELADPTVAAPPDVDAVLDDLETLESLLVGETMSGRGLRVVDEVASAWGVDYGEHDKTVWFRLLAGSNDHAGRRAGLEEGVGPAATAGGVDGLVTVQLLGLPVAASLASGNNVDDILREFQLLNRDPDGSNGLSPQVIARVERLLERSVDDRMASRAAARSALAAGRRRFDMTVRLPRWATGRVAALNDVLEEVAEASRAGLLLALPPSP
jgi:anti-sigma regulatory factor (Ser/Thr protein kinase)